MKIIEPGHKYQLEVYDKEPEEITTNLLQFVNREDGKRHSGTQTQEVLRALIDRTMHCDNCLRWEGNDKIIYHLRMALVLHEARALERKTEKGLLAPERVAFEEGGDGHFTLEQQTANESGEDAVRYDLQAVQETIKEEPNLNSDSVNCPKCGACKWKLIKNHNKIYLMCKTLGCYTFAVGDNTESPVKRADSGEASAPEAQTQSTLLRYPVKCPVCHTSNWELMGIGAHNFLKCKRTLYTKRDGFETPAMTYHRIVGLPWPGGEDSSIVSLLRIFGIKAAPGSEKANSELQMALIEVEDQRECYQRA